MLSCATCIHVVVCYMSSMLSHTTTCAVYGHDNTCVVVCDNICCALKAKIAFAQGLAIRDTRVIIETCSCMTEILCRERGNPESSRLLVSMDPSGLRRYLLRDGVAIYTTTSVKRLSRFSGKLVNECTNGIPEEFGWLVVPEGVAPVLGDDRHGAQKVVAAISQAVVVGVDG